MSSIGEKKIDYIELPAADLERAKVFFQGLFGWSFEDYGPDYCSFYDGRLYGGFYRSELKSDVSAGSALVVFYQADLEQAHKNVTDLGGLICKDIFEFPGGRRFHFTDPNGNEYAIWSDQ